LAACRMVIVWAAIIGPVLRITKQVTGGWRLSDRSPPEIAAIRLAKGEIDKEEFEELKATLRR